jgi:hypothetical protein
LTVSHHTIPSGGTALPAETPHHGSETSPGTGWQSGSHSASGKTCGMETENLNPTTTLISVPDDAK